MYKIVSLLILVCINTSAFSQVLHMSVDEGWRLLQTQAQRQELATIEQSIAEQVDKSQTLTAQFSPEQKGYSLLFNNQEIQQGKLGVGCRSTGRAGYECIAFNLDHCKIANLDANGNIIDDWQVKSDCGFNNPRQAIAMYNSLDMSSRAGIIGNYYAVATDYDIQCPEGFERWALKLLPDNKYLLAVSNIARNLDFLYDDSSRRDSSFCLIKDHENLYKIIAPNYKPEQKSNYLNQVSTLFSRDSNTAGLFSIVFPTAQEIDNFEELIKIQFTPESTISTNFDISKSVDNKRNYNIVQYYNVILNLLFKIIIVIFLYTAIVFTLSRYYYSKQTENKEQDSLTGSYKGEW